MERGSLKGNDLYLGMGKYMGMCFIQRGKGKQVFKGQMTRLHNYFEVIILDYQDQSRFTGSCLADFLTREFFWCKVAVAYV